MSEQIYASTEARARALHLGMWIFLGSETLLFAGLFGLYSAYRASYPAEFSAAIAHQYVLIGTANTVILLTSSFFVACAVRVMRGDRRRFALISLAIAITLGLAFLVLKVIEYSQHLAEGIAPGLHYASHELPSAGARTFFTLYYVMTGLHALHVIAGLVILGWLTSRIARRRLTEHAVELELGGLYWHLVDIVWIFLWPLLYLIE